VNNWCRELANIPPACSVGQGVGFHTGKVQAEQITALTIKW